MKAKQRADFYREAAEDFSIEAQHCLTGFCFYARNYNENFKKNYLTDGLSVIDALRNNFPEYALFEPNHNGMYWFHYEDQSERITALLLCEQIALNEKN